MATILVKSQWVEDDILCFDLHQPSTSPADDFELDVSRFAQLISSHIFFEHLDVLFPHLSKTIATLIQDTIQVNINTKTDNVDPPMLKQQINDAIAAYISDQLPLVWYKHASALDRHSLHRYVERQVSMFCKPDVVTRQCVDAHGRQLLIDIDRYTKENAENSIQQMMVDDLPVLVENARRQVELLLVQLEQLVLQSPEDSLTLKEQHDKWIIDVDQANKFIQSVLRLKHRHTNDNASKDNQFTIQKAALLARAN